jgi:hypothetical protein
VGNHLLLLAVIVAFIAMRAYRILTALGFEVKKLSSEEIR